MRLLHAAIVALACAQASPLIAATPGTLKCEYARNPSGIDVPQPRLYWQLESDVPGEKQTACQILVASSPELLQRNRADRWNSGKIKTEETIHIRYEGRRLASSEQVFWKVRTWDQDGRVSDWSETASWTMGVLNPADWQAHWITAPWLSAKPPASNSNQTLLLRKDFTVRKGLKRAVAHICGLGQYEMSINGQKLGRDILSPGWTKYDKTCLYDTHDLTRQLKVGTNAVGVMLANGMYNVIGGRYQKFTGSFGPLKMIAQIHLEYLDGSRETLVSDGTWSAARGPITFACVFGGEDYDARLNPAGWNEPGFTKAAWERAEVVNGPGGQLRGITAAAPPIRTFENLRPIASRQISPAIRVYDLGQNAALIPEITLKGPAGAIVRIIPAELIKPDGTVDRVSVGGGEAWWQYTLAGNPDPETWFPKFFYHGCRYLQVECSAPESQPLPEILQLQGKVIHADSEPIGEFASSSELFNRIHKLVRWAQRSNMMSLMTDCPHREKLGWLEETHLNGPALRYEFNLTQLFTKTMNDMADSQISTGLVPDIAPEYVVFDSGFRDSPEWGSALLLVPWQQYQFTGDIELMKRYYDPMKRYVAYLGSRATNHIVSHGLGDWYDIGPNPPGVAQLTPIPLTATAFYYYDCFVLSQAAALLGKPADATRYAELASQIKTAFNQRFFDATKHRYAAGSQAANAIPLVMDLVEPSNRSKVIQAVVEDVRNRGNALTAGDVGYRYLLRALADAGRSDVIFDMNHQSEKPGYGYMLRQGATSLTEAWDARRDSSNNHFMLGQINEWFYHDLAGIQCDPSAPGFKKILIKPAVVGDLTSVSATYHSLRGKIASSWRKEAGRLTLKVRIPPGSTATIFVPARETTPVRILGEPQQKLARALPRQQGWAPYSIPSGTYEFQSEL